MSWSREVQENLRFFGNLPEWLAQHRASKLILALSLFLPLLSLSLSMYIYTKQINCNHNDEPVDLDEKLNPHWNTWTRSDSMGRYSMYITDPESWISLSEIINRYLPQKWLISSITTIVLNATRCIPRTWPFSWVDAILESLGTTFAL